MSQLYVDPRKQTVVDAQNPPIGMKRIPPRCEADFAPERRSRLHWGRSHPRELRGPSGEVPRNFAPVAELEALGDGLFGGNQKDSGLFWGESTQEVGSPFCVVGNPTKNGQLRKGLQVYLFADVKGLSPAK